MPAPSLLDLRFLKALAAHKKGDRAGARAQLQSILDEDPKHADSLEVLGMLLSEESDLDGAIALTLRLLELRPQSIMGHANISRFFMLKGDKATAEEWQGKARVLGWKEEIARKGAAASPGQGLDAPPDPEAVTRQEEAVHLAPDDVRARMALASSYRKLGMPVKAIGHLREALKREREMSVLYLDLGKALEEANLPAQAVEVYREGIPVAERRGDFMPRNQMQSRLQALERKAGRV